MKRILPLALATLFLCACQSSSRTHFQEGNLLAAPVIAGLTIGMSKEQVAQHMGTPVYESLFRKNRWVYVHHVRNGSIHRTEELSLDFENNRLAHISKR